MEVVQGYEYRPVASWFELDGDGASGPAAEESTHSLGSVPGGPRCVIR